MAKIEYAQFYFCQYPVKQQAGIAVLSSQGRQECQQKIDYYLTNAHLLKQTLSNCNFTCYGGTDNPYIWLKAPGEMTSWQFFDQLLHETGIVGIPGNLFGKSGESYLRLSALGKRDTVETIVKRLSEI